ncbi:hypothetical protein QTP86_006693 [Hemibagrus guttatus]|nr:hypothetical protein QTP86_006693 [Hemibagrus guttatus]
MSQADVSCSARQRVFQEALRKGNTAELHSLLRGMTNCEFNVNSFGPEGQTALHQSVIDGNLELVKLLVKFGADVRLANRDGWSALHMAAFGGHQDIALYLITRANVLCDMSIYKPMTMKVNNTLRPNIMSVCLTPGKMGKRKDLSQFDEGQIVMARRMDQSISKTAALVGCSRSAVNSALTPQSPAHVPEKACQTLVSITAFTGDQNILSTSSAVPNGQRDVASQPSHLFLWV